MSPMNKQSNSKNVFYTKADNSLLDTEYSLLNCNPDDKIERLADYIIRLLEPYKKDVYYFTLPIWDFEDKIWVPNTVGRFYNDTNDEWEKSGVLTDEKKAYRRYLEFFQGAQKNFSFIEFFTNDIAELTPILTIDFVTCDCFKLNKDSKNFYIHLKKDYAFDKNNPDYYDDKDKFIHATNQLVNASDKSKKRIILDGFYEFLCRYKEHYPHINYIYLFPSLLFKNDKSNRHISSGGVILVCKGIICWDILMKIAVISNLCYREVGNKNWAKVCNNEAIKSAVSAIMSRNMSHNLGSHYLYYTKSQLEQQAAKDGDIAPDIRGAAKVLGYLQSRMDFLATIISNNRYPYGSVNFKSQIFDELTIDDFSHRHFHIDCNKRTTNFLLKNLVLSENFTRQDVRLDNKIEAQKDKLFINAKYSDDGKEYKCFTGSWDLEEEQKEIAIKKTLSSLNLALPGGVMSCHAFFNIVENFIRNSAKYRRNEIKAEEGLKIYIAIRPNPENEQLKDILIYDNKENANNIVKHNKGIDITLFSQIEEKLKSLEIIDESNQLSLKNKGFKEILFSSIWMNAYKYREKTYARVIAEINSENVPEKRISMIEEYGFSLVRVQDKTIIEKSNDGTEKETNIINVYKRQERCNGAANLGLLITLPIYSTCKKLEWGKNPAKNVNLMLNVMADVVEVDKSFLDETNEYRHAFTRVITLNANQTSMSTLDKYMLAVKKRFKDIDKYALCFADTEEADSGQTKIKPVFKPVKENLYRLYDFESDFYFKDTNSKYKIYFYRHLDSKENAKNYSKLAYADTISGANFTISLAAFFRNGIDERGFYKSDNDELLALKIKESALTRITIIDERLFNMNCDEDGNPSPWLTLKNVRLLNYNDEFDDKSTSCHSVLSSVFKGNKFRNNRNGTHFLTIHLGLIEKILKNSQFVNNLIDKELSNDNETSNTNRLAPERVEAFMALLNRTFRIRAKSYQLCIAIHSGRGNYSEELQGPLSGYPYLTLSALESAFNNSKYQLSQLFYNTIYIGKGIANK